MRRCHPRIAPVRLCLCSSIDASVLPNSNRTPASLGRFTQRAAQRSTHHGHTANRNIRKHPTGFVVEYEPVVLKPDSVEQAFKPERSKDAHAIGSHVQEGAGIVTRPVAGLVDRRLEAGAPERDSECGSARCRPPMILSQQWSGMFVILLVTMAPALSDGLSAACGELRNLAANVENALPQAAGGWHDGRNEANIEASRANPRVANCSRSIGTSGVAVPGIIEYVRRIAAEILALDRRDLSCMTMLLFGGGSIGGGACGCASHAAWHRHDDARAAAAGGICALSSRARGNRIELTEHARKWIERIWAPLRADGNRMLDIIPVPQLVILAKFMQQAANSSNAQTRQLRTWLDAPSSGQAQRTCAAGSRQRRCDACSCSSRPISGGRFISRTSLPAPR